MSVEEYKVSTRYDELKVKQTELERLEGIDKKASLRAEKGKLTYSTKETIELKDTRLPIKMWLEDIEEGALQQAINLANLPFAFKHIALMPDCHQGYGMPIGGVLATESIIVPNAVGSDIGCENGFYSNKHYCTIIKRDNDRQWVFNSTYYF